MLDDKWGDWKPHLSMIMSNPTSRSDLDRKSIIILGDTLGGWFVVLDPKGMWTVLWVGGLG